MPTPALPFWKKTELLRRLLTGHSRDEAAKGLLSAGEASKVKGEFINYAGVFGLSAAGRHYDVANEVEALLSLAQDMKKKNIWIDDTLQGRSFYALLDELGVPHDEALGLIKTLRVASHTERPERFFEAAGELAKAEESGYSFSEAVPEYKENVEKIVRIQEEERQKTATHEEEKQRKTTRHEEAERRRTIEVTKAEEEKLRVAKEYLSNVNAEIPERQRELKRVNDELENQEKLLAEKRKMRERFLAQEKAVLAKEKWVNSALATFRKYNVNDPEGAAKMLAAIGKEGSAGKVIDMIRRLGSLNEAVNAEKKKFTEVQTRVVEVQTQLGEEKKRFSALDEKLATTEEQCIVKERELKALISKIATVEGVGESLDALNNREKETNRKVTALGREVTVLKTKRDGLESVVSGKQKELEIIIRGIAEAHGVEADFAKVEAELKRFKLSVQNEHRRLEGNLKRRKARVNETFEEFKETKGREKVATAAEIQELNSQKETVTKEIKGELDKVSRAVSENECAFALFKLSTASEGLTSLPASETLSALLAAVKGLRSYLRNNRKKAWFSRELAESAEPLTKELEAVVARLPRN